jgi:serine/threonine protein kinase
MFLTIGDDEDELCAVATQMLSALKHAHAKQLCHLDVKPSNIVLVSREPPRYLLVDWGCSRKMCDEVNGFIGSDNYAHDYVHMMDREQKDWKPVEQLDKASLLYTLVALSRNGQVPQIYKNSRMQQTGRRANRLVICGDSILEFGEEYVGAVRGVLLLVPLCIPLLQSRAILSGSRPSTGS